MKHTKDEIIAELLDMLKYFIGEIKISKGWEGIFSKHLISRAEQAIAKAEEE